MSDLGLSALVPDLQQLATTSNSSQRPVRLRLACDACAKTKVRCDKGRPACQRCVNNKLPCVYSVSRRNGSEPWYKRFQRRQSLESSNQLHASSHAYHSNCFSPNTSLPYFTVLSTGGNNVVPFSSSSSGGCDDIDGFLFGDPKDPMELLGGYEDQNSNPQFPPLWSPSGETPAAVASTALPEAGAPCNHDCEARATEIIHSLRYNPDHFTNLSRAATPSNEADTARDVAMPSVGKIILLNRKALANLPGLLECTCAQYPHLALLHVAILCKMLFLYRVVLCAHDTRNSAPGSEDQSPSSSGRGSSSSSMNPMPPVKIQIGELQLDADDQAILQSAILLRELRKMENMIQKMKVLDMTWANEEAETTGVLSATYWYRLSMPKICKELDTLIKMATDNHDKMFSKMP